MRLHTRFSCVCVCKNVLVFCLVQLKFDWNRLHFASTHKHIKRSVTISLIKALFTPMMKFSRSVRMEFHTRIKFEENGSLIKFDVGYLNLVDAYTAPRRGIRCTVHSDCNLNSIVCIRTHEDTIQFVHFVLLLLLLLLLFSLSQWKNVFAPFAQIMHTHRTMERTE